MAGKSLIKLGILVFLTLAFTAIPVKNSGLVSAAQTTAAPLVYSQIVDQDRQDGDLWTWNGKSVQQLTHWGHNFKPILSPDGKRVAYLSVPEFFINQREPDDYRLSPTNVYIIDPLTGQSTRIADQPANASLRNGEDAYILRSEPSWSPDSTQIAWTEIAFDRKAQQNLTLDDERLAIYNIAQKTSRILIPHLPAHRTSGDGPYLSPVYWGKDAFAVMNYPKSKHDIVTVYFYDLTGRLLSSTEPIEDSQSQVVWATDESANKNKSFLISIFTLLRIDPVSGVAVHVDIQHSVLEMYNPFKPHGFSLYQGFKDAEAEGNPDWFVGYQLESFQSLSAFQSGGLNSVAISPDAEQIAYIGLPGQGTEGGLFVATRSKQSQLFRLTAATTMVWGPTAWRIRHR